MRKSKQRIKLPRALTPAEYEFIGQICHWPDPAIYPEFAWLPKALTKKKLTFKMYQDLRKFVGHEDHNHPLPHFPTYKEVWATWNSGDPALLYELELYPRT